MNNDLLIIGAGIRGRVAEEIAESMECFGKITLADYRPQGGESVQSETGAIDSFEEMEMLVCEYSSVFVAIADPGDRMSLIRRLEEETLCRVVTLISPKAYVSPSAQMMQGCLIEPMAAVHTGCVLEAGCVISAGAVVNQASMCCEGVHVDCNATVAGCTLVPAGTKVCSGTVFQRDCVDIRDFFLASAMGKAGATR